MALLRAWRRNCTNVQLLAKERWRACFRRPGGVPTLACTEVWSMSSLTLDVADWAEQQFGTCEFGDIRRTRRMVKLATQVATKPDAATPKQTENWGDCKAAYRWASQEEVTFD